MRHRVDVKKFGAVLTESNLDEYVGHLFLIDDDTGYLYILAEVDVNKYALINLRTGGRYAEALGTAEFISVMENEDYSLFNGVVTLSTV